MSLNDYRDALRLGEKAFQSSSHKGGSPYLVALDDILENSETEGEVKLGLVQIPIELIVGTYSEGRKTAFASNFMPLMEDNSEFASKWISLSDAHLKEGIRDPIKAYEYMNRFYVMEGNKRVSVLKFFGAVTIPGNVTRIIPKRTNTKENRIYFEFLDFYKYTQINYLFFSEEGSYKKITKAVGKDPGKQWTEEELLDFRSAYIRFQKAFQAKGGTKTSMTIGDAMLTYLGVFTYDELKSRTDSELKKDLGKIWKDVSVPKESKVEISMDPEPSASKKTILTRILPAPKCKVAFIHDRNADSSSWTYAHELGRLHLEDVFKDKILTCHYDNKNTEESAYAAIEDAIKNGYKVIFTTAPQLTTASIRSAIQHKDVRIFNCSLNSYSPYIKTYYVRMYEAKFLAGALAGTMADNNKIGYVTGYPVYGSIANLNAFAFGASMVNPRAKIYLEWSTVKDRDIDKTFLEEDVSYVSYHDMIRPDAVSKRYGLYHLAPNGETTTIALPVWNWGKQYEILVKDIMAAASPIEEVLSGDLTAISKPKTQKATNYWWGMNTGVVDILCSEKLPIATKRLVEFFRKAISNGEFNPFTGIMYAQDGTLIQSSETKSLSYEEIINMNWLAQNVVGSIPTIDDLVDEAKPLFLLQGVNKEN